MELELEEMREFLDGKARQYNHPGFIEEDPIQIPHMYEGKEDIEIAGFMAAVIAWGNRTSILKSAHRMMDLLGNAPYDFVMNHREEHLDRLAGFVHRTFNSVDLVCFLQALRHLYRHHGGLEGVFLKYQTESSLQPAIHQLKRIFFEGPHPSRSTKHLPDPLKGSAAKRINMYLRWMVRKDSSGVDFGLWKQVEASKLSCPLDVHTASVARKLGLLKRSQNDAKAVEELDESLRSLDPEDPVKYDFALFGLGIYEKF
jgi:uncharacterized protein (TIGR02757 family)